MALFHHRSLGQWKSISTRGALKLAAANIPFENSSTAFGALHPYGQSNILEIVNTTILVRKSTEKVFEQHRSVFFHKSSCILAIYKDIYIELTKISTAITTQKGNKNKLAADNIRHIYDAWHERKDVDHFARLVSNDDILDNDANISVSSYVEPEDNTEKIDIHELNQRIAEIVAKENVLRTEIDKIVAELQEA